MNFNKIKLINTILLFVLFSSFSVYSKTDEEFSTSENEYNYSEELKKMRTKPLFGIFLDYGFNFHNAGFRGLPGIPNCCSNFETGNGSGFEYGVSAQFFINPLWSFGARASLSNLHGEFIKRDEFPVILKGELNNGIIENQIDVSNNIVSFFPFISYNIEPISKNFFSYLGVKLALPVSATFSQYEKLISPETGTFTDGTRIRNVHSGELPEKSSLLYALTVGISYELPLTKTGYLHLSPELYYTYWLLSPVKDISWNVSQLNFGLAFKYRTPPPPPPPPAEPILPNLPDLQIPTDKKTFIVDVDAFKVDKNKMLNRDVEIVVEDFTYVNLNPILNYIFFEENSSELPSRYKLLNSEQADRFNVKQLRNLNVIETYYHVLNIVGSRLREYSDADIELIGTNTNTDGEKGNLQLSEQRAISVKNYLVDVWKIDESRIKVVARNLPKEATLSQEEGGIDENRRVEIWAKDKRIIESILVFDTLKVIQDLEISFIPKIESTFGIKEWDFKILENNNEIAKWTGKNETPNEIIWKTADAKFGNDGDNVQYILQVTDKIGQKASSNKKEINVKTITVDTKRKTKRSDIEYENYSLILFDFGSRRLEAGHKQVVDFIKDRVKSNSIVTISGYTDYIGEEAVNRKLAYERAKAVAQRLSISNAEVRGIGESELLYDNSLPEGRFYCRTVTITIETPVNSTTN